MRRVLTIAAVVLAVGACGNSTTHSSPDSPPADPGAGPSGTIAVDPSVASPSSLAPQITLPESSGDAELDAFGQELAALEHEFSALDAAAETLETTP